VTAFNAGGSGTTTSAPTATVPQVPPTNTAAPVIRADIREHPAGRLVRPHLPDAGAPRTRHLLDRVPSGVDVYGVAGFRWHSVNNSRAINSNTYTSGPSNPFGPLTPENREMSVYATYTPGK
jgi:hypothetical protein